MEFRKEWLIKSPSGKKAEEFIKSRARAQKRYSDASNKKEEKIAWKNLQRHLPRKARRKRPYDLSKYDADLISTTIKTFPQYGLFDLEVKLQMIPRWKIYKANPIFMSAFTGNNSSEHYRRLIEENGLVRKGQDGKSYKLTNRGRQLQTAGNWFKLLDIERADFTAIQARNRRDKLWVGTILLVAFLGWVNTRSKTAPAQPNIQFHTQPTILPALIRDTVYLIDTNGHF